MINKIEIKKYRKLENINFEFKEGINIISGTNGTCKTSLLHIISNSFQAVIKTADWVNDTKILDIIKGLNKLNNPKIESLTRGDDEYNDPAPGVEGPLFKCTYYDEKILEFRRHNTSKGEKNRFAIKPKYPVGKRETLPMFPVIYLGLFRLFSFGEFLDDEKIKKITNKFPVEYLNEIKKIYENFTGIKVEYQNQVNMGGIKNRAQFKSKEKGIDSNTISAGEDNLFIILTALISLRYYFENINSNNKVESILLIDEIDATLHPAFQIKLLDLFKEYSQKYKIQIIFTTHSVSLLEYGLMQKQNVIYLIDNINKVELMEDVNYYKIEMFLKNKTRKEIFLPKKIPIFTEDDEARLILKELMDFYKDKDEDFKKVITSFHLVNAKFSCETLKNIFQKDKILQNVMPFICILDGDNEKNLKNKIGVLPGKAAPEKVFFDYAIFLYESDDCSDFWSDSTIINQGISKINYRENVKSKIDEMEENINKLKLEGRETKGIRREKSKKIFNDNIDFFTFLIRYWLNDKNNDEEIKNFFKDLNILFKKVAIEHRINPNDWSV